MNKKFFSVLLTFVVFGGFIYWIWTLPIPWYIQLSISIATIGIRLIIFALIDAKPLPTVAGDEYQPFTSRNTSLSLHPTTKLTLVRILNYSLFGLYLYLLIFWMAPKLYSATHASTSNEPIVNAGVTRGIITEDKHGNRWQEYNLPITKAWSSFAFDDTRASQLWPNDDSVFLQYANGTRQIKLYPLYMGRSDTFRSNHFDLKLPDASAHESDVILFKIAVH